MNHFFPDLYGRLSAIADPRSGGSYSLESLLLGGLSLFLFKQGSRHQQNQLRQDRVFRRNYCRILGVDLPHGDTVESLLRQLSPEELQGLLQVLVRQLLNKKVFHKFRLLGKYFLVAIDGSGTGSFTQAPSDHAIHKTRGDKTRWYEYVLEAKLVCPNGFCISLCSEWVENPEGDFDKQDCELKAFARLADRLKKAFPRLPICLLGDGLYPNKTFFKICQQKRWKYILTFKDGNLPSVWKEIRSLEKLGAQQTYKDTKTTPSKRIEAQYQTLKDLPYDPYTFHWIECCRQIHLKDDDLKDDDLKDDSIVQTNRFVHITNIPPTDRKQTLELSRAGQQRWKIENEGFNTQKNQGYTLEHKFSRASPQARKNYYLLLQIAHMIHQLTLLSTRFDNLTEAKKTTQFLFLCLIALILMVPLTVEESKPPQRGQIRFAT